VIGETLLIIRFRESQQQHEYESRVNKFEEIQRQLLKTGKAVIQHLTEMMLFLNYCILSGSAEALVRCGGKL